MRPENNAPFVFPSPVNTENLIRRIDPFWYFIRDEAGLNDVRLHDRPCAMPMLVMNWFESAAEKIGLILAGCLDAI